MFISVNGHDHLDVAASYNNIGAVYMEQGRYQEALDHYQKSLDIKIKLVGHLHPDVATSYSNMAVVHGRQGHYDESDRLLDAARNIRIKVHGFHHPSLAKSHVNKAWIKIKQENESECREHLVRALETGYLWTAVAFLKTEDDFKALRNAVWFQDLLQDAEAAASKRL